MYYFLKDRNNILYPYFDLTSVNQWQVRQVVKDKSIKYFSLYSYSGIENFSKLAKELDDCNHPVLKFLVANSAKPNEDHSMFLDQAMNDKRYEADVWLLRASTAFRKNEEIEKVADYLIKAMSVSTDELQRKALDSYLVDIVRNGKTKKKIEDWGITIRNAVQDAERRLLAREEAAKAKDRLMRGVR